VPQQIKGMVLIGSLLISQLTEILKKKHQDIFVDIFSEQ
jgi:hypothetical protein